MKIWAIGDLHLSFGIPNKSMDVFGKGWENHAERLAENWKKLITDEDLVLIPGDISWAMHLKDVKPDLDWIHALPGTKLLLRGNHDYWWSSMKQIKSILPPSLHLIQNNAFDWNGISVAGARLWDSKEYSFGQYIDYVPNERARVLTAHDENLEEAERIFERELGRLEISLKCLNPKASHRIVMTHYPPIGATLEEDSRVSKILEKYGVNICVFGHLHNLKEDFKLFGHKNGVRYILTSCDYLKCMPIEVLEL